MSKERARRRAQREHEAGLRAAARAAEQERRERREARGKALRGFTTAKVRLSATGRQSGVLARRRRRQTSMLVAGLLAVVVLVWVVRPDWPARLASLVMVVLAFPVFRTLLFGSR